MWPVTLTAVIQTSPVKLKIWPFIDRWPAVILSPDVIKFLLILSNIIIILNFSGIGTATILLKKLTALEYVMHQFTVHLMLNS